MGSSRNEARSILAEAVEALASAHLDRKDRRRVMLCLDSLPSVVRPGEHLVLLTDAVVKSEVGLLVCSSERLLFLSEDRSGSLVVELDRARLEAHASPGVMGYADLLVVSGDLTHCFASVGDLGWAMELADALNREGADVGSPSDQLPEECVACGADVVLTHDSWRCLNCGIAGEFVASWDDGEDEVDDDDGWESNEVGAGDRHLLRLVELAESVIDDDDLPALAPCIEALAQALGSDETSIWMTDCRLQEDDGVLLLSTERLLFVDLDGGLTARRVDTVADARSAGGDALLVTFADRSTWLCLDLGGETWATEFAAVVGAAARGPAAAIELASAFDGTSGEPTGVDSATAALPTEDEDDWATRAARGLREP